LALSFQESSSKHLKKKQSDTFIDVLECIKVAEHGRSHPRVVVKACFWQIDRKGNNHAGITTIEDFQQSALLHLDELT